MIVHNLKYKPKELQMSSVKKNELVDGNGCQIYFYTFPRFYLRSYRFTVLPWMIQPKTINECCITERLKFP